MYGHVSATQLEEFIVIKYNKKNKPQDRMLCIDGFNIYTKELTKDAKKGGAQSAAPGAQSGSLWNTFTNKVLGVKQKKRPITSIIRS